jgi:hypothetical protein
MSAKSYTISALAKPFDVSHRTIRFSEENRSRSFEPGW